MPDDQPIACTLTAAELPNRLAEIRAIGASSLRSADAGASDAVLHFDAEPGIRERLSAIVAAESRCCAFLDFDLADAPDELVLMICAPKGGEPVMHELVEAFRGSGSVAA